MNFETLRRELESAGPSAVHKLYEWAERKPARDLLYYGEEDRSMTYGEFNDLTNSVANFLKTNGISKGDKVSVYLYNPIVTALAMFGIWKAGAVFSPINYNYKGRLLSYQLNDTAPKLLITEQSRLPFINDVKSDLPGLNIVVRKPGRDEHDFTSEADRFGLDKKFQSFDFDTLLKGNTSHPDTEINYWDRASIIYTSGTTGAAKGVVQSHRWIAQYTFTTRRVTHEDDIGYSDVPMYHISGAYAGFARVVWTGSRIAVWDRFSPKDFWNRIRKSGSSSCALMDVMMPWLMNAGEKPTDRDNSLKWVHMQPLPHYHNKIAKRFGFDVVTVGYGSTETGSPIGAIIDELGTEKGTPPELYRGYAKECILEKFRECGYPVLSGTDEIKKGFMGRALVLEPAILNEHDEILGPGECGQLAFRSRISYGLPSGYYNQPEATLEANRNHWLHTGDACYRDENDIYYFVDRMGNFVRVRGENISTYQIEDVINSHPSVEISAAFPIPALEGEEDDLVLYVTLKNGEHLDEDALKKWIAGQMPKFMWPKYIRFSDALPQTATSKIEKYKLKELIIAELKRMK
ncbi:MAG: AMP-binding protein [Deltaproteobacteria bacterium]